MTQAQLKVLILAADDFEDSELLYPFYRLAEEDIEVTVAGLDAGPVRGKKGHGPFPVDTTVDRVAEPDFAALVIPGGYAPDKLRRSQYVLDLVRAFDAAGKPIAFICHAGWVPISAKILKGRRATSVGAIRDDMENAGVDWVDEPAVVDGNLISARTPADLGPWMKALLAALPGRSAGAADRADSWMTDFGLGSWPHRRARIDPDRPAFRQGEGELTYRQLADRVKALAGALHAAGVRRGDRVAYLAANSIAGFETFFAAGRLGAIFAPLNTRLTTPELTYLVRDCAPTVLVHDQDVGALTGPDSPVSRSIALADDGPQGYQAFLEAGLDQRPPETEVGLDDDAVILYTSGTTGRPKGAVLTHGNLTFNTMNQLAHADVLRTDTALAIAPLFHASGLGQVSLPTLFKGGRVAVLPRFDPALVLAAIQAPEDRLLRRGPDHAADPLRPSRFRRDRPRFAAVRDLRRFDGLRAGRRRLAAPGSGAAAGLRHDRGLTRRAPGQPRRRHRTPDLNRHPAFLHRRSVQPAR